MSSSSSGGNKLPSGAPRLLLRFSMPGLPPDEVYVARKLTIGRTPDNVFVIPEETVDRHHAIVDFRQSDTGGEFVVRCLQADSFLEVEGQRVRELTLRPGVRFRIASGEFECLAAPEVTPKKPERDWSCCPRCNSFDCRTLRSGMGSCPACGQEVTVVQDNMGRRIVLPRQVGPCRLVRLIGHGGMAWVFEGTLEGRPEPVAVKILMPHLLAEPAALQRFRRETEILASIRHPRVLRRLGRGTWHHLPCLITPLMPAGSLKKVIEEYRKQKQLCPFSLAWQWFCDVVQGLQALHAAGLVHRDLKPSNVLLDAQARAVVADLGIARRLASETASLTVTGSTIGTFQYMAPEQLENPDTVDPRADQYALGVTFYELLTGELPRGRWLPPSRLNPTVPTSFDKILERLLEPRPERRFPSLQHLGEELLRLGLIADRPAPQPAPQSLPVSEKLPPPMPGQAPRIPRPWGVWLGSAGFLGIVTAVALLVVFALVARPELRLVPAVGHALAPPAPGIHAVAWAPNGKSVLTGGADGAAVLWDLQTGREIRRFEGHTEFLTSLAFSPDGKQVLTGSWDNTARLWDVATGREIRRLEGHTAPVVSVAFSPDGKQVLTGSADKTARLWDVATGSEIRRFERHTEPVWCVAFSPDGAQVLTAPWDKAARLWDVATGSEIRRFEGHTQPVTSVAFSPDGKQVLTGSRDNTARLWDVGTGSEIRRFERHTERITSVAFSPDGKQVLTGSLDNTARLWDVATGSEIRRFEGHTEPVSSVAFGPDGTQVLTGSADNTARLWDVATGREIRRFEGHTEPVTSAAFSSDGKQVLTGSRDNSARLWDVATGSEIRRFEGHTAPVTSVAFGPDGAQVLTGSADNTARLWNAATGSEIRRFEGHTEPVVSVAFSPDGTQVLTGSADNTARLWDVVTGREIRRFEGHTQAVTSVAFGPDGTQVLTGSFDNTARLWNAATGSEIRRFEGHTAPVVSVAFSLHGKQVLTGSLDKTARLWDVATGSEIRRFEGHTLWVLSVAFSPDGTQVLTGSFDNTARLWNAATGSEIRRFEGHTQPVTSVAFSPDGTEVLTGSADGTARIWNIRGGRELCVLYHLEGGRWAVITPKAFCYDGSGETREIVMNSLSVVQAPTAPPAPITPEEFRKFYRPDLVQEFLQRRR